MLGVILFLFFKLHERDPNLKLSCRKHSSNFQALGDDIKHLDFHGEKRRLKKETRNICLR